MTRRAAPALAAALAAALALPARAQEPAAAAPDPRAVLAHFVAAVGGAEALARTTPRRETGRMEIAAANLTVRYEAWYADGRTYTRSEMPGLGVVRTGFDGAVAWVINPATGPALLEGVALRQAAQAADPLAAVHPARFVAGLEALADTVFEGEACHALRVTTAWGERYSEFFDRETGLLAGSLRTQVTPQGSIPVTSHVVEWRTVGAARLPGVTRTRMLGREFVSTVDSTVLGPVPDSLFALPPEIHALLGGGR